MVRYLKNSIFSAFTLLVFTSCFSLVWATGINLDDPNKPPSTLTTIIPPSPSPSAPSATSLASSSSSSNDDDVKVAASFSSSSHSSSSSSSPSSSSLSSSSSSSTNLLEDYGGRWTKNLNISYKDIRTGPGGNVKAVFKGYPDFDIEQIHKTLLQKEVEETLDRTGSGEGARNTTVAGLSLIMKSNDGYYAIFERFRSKKNKIIVFSSGSKSKKIPDFSLGSGPESRGFTVIDAQADSSYDPINLLSNFQRRCKYPLTTYHPLSNVPLELYTKWVVAQEKAVTSAKSIIATNILTGSFPTVSKLLDAISTNDSIVRELRESDGNFGSSVDSEQFLLSYLEENLLRLDEALGRPSGKIPDLHVSYKQQQESMSRTVETDTISGAILHLHTYREMCCCCSYSLTQQLRHRFYSQIKNFLPSPSPFFHVSVSASVMIKPTETDKQRLGIRNFDLNPNQYDTNNNIQLESVIEQGVIVQKILPPTATATATATEKGKDRGKSKK